MKVAVIGLWHLGSVTAACAASAGHEVVGWDPDARVVANLSRGLPAISEPGLSELVQSEIAAARLSFESNVERAVADADVVWIAFDTPVDEEDCADVGFVLRHAEQALSAAREGALVLSSSQMPAGTMQRLQEAVEAARPDAQFAFACSPENLRLGTAIEVFMHPDRVIAGVRDDRARDAVAALFAPITSRIEYMSIESAEMTKHAINAFLAASVTLINELASLCECVGADARDVARGLKTERRIGPHAYLSPGAAFAGGTLARDVRFLQALGEQTGRPTPLADGIAASNRAHRHWLFTRLRTELPDLRGARVAVWGLTYKPGTDTLRRSAALGLIESLLSAGARVTVHDPMAGSLPELLTAAVRADNALDAARDADALVIATEWPQYRLVEPDALHLVMATPLVIDPNGFAVTLAKDPRFRSIRVGQPG